MVPLTAYQTRRFSTRQIVITSMSIFTIGSLMAWVSPTFILVLLGRMLEAIGTGVMWPVLQITVVLDLPALPPRHGDGHGGHGHECGPGHRSDLRRLADRRERLALDLPDADGNRRVRAGTGPRSGCTTSVPRTKP